MDSINQLLKDNRLLEVLDYLLTVANISNEDKISITMQISRLNKLEEEERQSLISHENKNIERNKIRIIITGIACKILGEDAVLKTVDNNGYLKQFDLSEHLKDIFIDNLDERDFSMFDIPQDLINKTNENRIILIACPYKKLIVDATYAFINYYEKQFTKFPEKKDFKGASLNQSGAIATDDRETMNIKGNSHVSIDLDLFLSGKIAKDQLIVIDLVDGDLSQNFLKSMTTRYRGIANAKEELTRSNNLLVVNISGKDISGEENQDLFDELENHLWQVPFLSSYLKRYDQQHLEEKILAQQKNGNWSPYQYNFYHELKPHLSKFSNALEKACQERELGIHDAAARNEKEVINLILEKEKKPLRRYLIFLITFFGEISDDDFDYLLHTLVKDDKKLLKDYNKGYEKLLQDCHIQRMSNNEDDFTDMVLDFSNPDYRNQAIHYFFVKDFQFARTQCNTLLLQGLLIQQKPSYPAYRNLVKLLGRVSKASSGYSLKLLKCLLAAIFTKKASIDINLPENEIYETLKQKSDDGGLNWLDLHGYGVLVELIQEMSYHDRLFQDIKEFYDFLIFSRLHNIALRVVDFMPFSSKIDKIEWLRRLINNGMDTVKEEAFKRLLSIAPRNEEQLYNYLDRLNEWIPPEDTDPATYSPSNKFGLKFILNYLYRTYGAIGSPFSDFGASKPPYPLFALLQNTQLVSNEWIKNLVGWLFHSHVEVAFNNGKEDISITKKRYYFDVAMLIEHWYAILHGLSEEAKYPENLNIFDKMMDFISLKIKENGKENEIEIVLQTLVYVWNQNARDYELEMQYFYQIGKLITDVEQKKIVEQNNREVAFRRYLLIEKFIPRVMEKLDPLVINSLN